MRFTNFFILFVFLCSFHSSILAQFDSGERVKECPPNWLLYGKDKCFKFFKEKMSHHHAEKHCNSLGAHLASVRTAEENELLVNYVLRDSQYNWLDYTWIGGLKFAKNSTRWIWLDVSPMRYSNWKSGSLQTTDYDQCLSLATDKNVFDTNIYQFGKFSPLNCNDVHYYICQKLLLPYQCTQFPSIVFDSKKFEVKEVTTESKVYDKGQ